MDRRLEQIAKEIKEEFCRRVIPSDIVRYLRCLTTQDIEKVQAEEKQNGAIQAADVLFQRLVRRCDWLHQLIQALPDVGLKDFGETVKKKSRQLVITIDAPGRCPDGHNCPKESTPVTYEIMPPQLLPTLCHDSKQDSEESCGELRQRVKYKVFDKMLNSVNSPNDFPGMMAYAEQICTRIDQIVHKCLLMMFRMETEEKLEAFWQLYETGGLAAALSRDILTLERRQQMIEDARIEGVELQESDFSLQVYIHESDYAFLKDVLRQKNIPLSARNSFESALLHGKRNINQTQDERNKVLSDFRRIMPTKLQTIMDDPFIREFVPGYFEEMAKQDAIGSVRYCYATIISKLQSEFKNALSDPANHLLQLAYFLLKNGTDSCSSRKMGDNVEVLLHTSKIVIPETSFKYFQINTNNIRFQSTLVLTFLAFEYIEKFVPASNNDADMKVLSSSEYFPIIAGALYEPLKMKVIVQDLLPFPSKMIMEYLNYYWLTFGTIDLELVQALSYIDLIMPAPFLCIAARDAEKIELGISVVSSSLLTTPDQYHRKEVYQGVESELHNTTANLVDIDTPVVNTEIEIIDPLPRSSSRFRLVTPHRADENEFMFLPILNETPTAECFLLPHGSKDVLSHILSIARVMNLKGPGKITLKQVTDPRDIDQQNCVMSKHILIDYEVTSKFKADGSIKIGFLAIDISSFLLTDSDISELEHAFASGLEVTELQLPAGCLNFEHITRICKAAIATNISHLNLSENSLFTSKPDLGLGIGLGSLATLEVLEMRDCGLGNVGMEALRRDFLSLKRLRCIDISKNGITEPGLKTFCRSLKNSNGIRVLRLHENDFGVNGGQIISMLLERLDVVEILNLCYCGLGDQGIVVLANVMDAKSIRKINLRGNGITKIGSLEVFKCFNACPHLYHIEYSQNEIGKLQCQTEDRIVPYVPDEPDIISGSVVDMLWSCQKSIEYLGLWECGIGNTSIIDDARLFSGMTELTELILQTNELQNTHAAILGECLPVLKQLESLVLRDNQIGPLGAIKLTNGIEKCPTLKQILLDYNNIDDYDVLSEIVETATKALHNLQELDISFNFGLMLVARESKGYKRLLEIAKNSLDNPKIKEEQLKTEIGSKSKLIVI